jgi:anti-anti-sigma regulatory factor
MDSNIKLAANLHIRDSVALKERLLPLLVTPDPVVIDVTDVEHVDTAALQLLFAFSRDRRAGGRVVLWRGESVAWLRGIATLDTGAGAPAALTNI